MTDPSVYRDLGFERLEHRLALSAAGDAMLAQTATPGPPNSDEMAEESRGRGAESSRDNANQHAPPGLSRSAQSEGRAAPSDREKGTHSSDIARQAPTDRRANASAPGRQMPRNDVGNTTPPPASRPPHANADAADQSSGNAAPSAPPGHRQSSHPPDDRSEAAPNRPSANENPRRGGPEGAGPEDAKRDSTGRGNPSHDNRTVEKSTGTRDGHSGSGERGNGAAAKENAAIPSENREPGRAPVDGNEAERQPQQQVGRQPSGEPREEVPRESENSPSNPELTTSDQSIQRGQGKSQVTPAPDKSAQDKSAPDKSAQDKPAQDRVGGAAERDTGGQKETVPNVEQPNEHHDEQATPAPVAPGARNIANEGDSASSGGPVENTKPHAARPSISEASPTEADEQYESMAILLDPDNRHDSPTGNEQEVGSVAAVAEVGHFSETAPAEVPADQPAVEARSTGAAPDAESLAEEPSVPQEVEEIPGPLPAVSATGAGIASIRALDEVLAQIGDAVDIFCPVPGALRGVLQGDPQTLELAIANFFEQFGDWQRTLADELHDDRFWWFALLTGTAAGLTLELARRNARRAEGEDDHTLANVERMAARGTAL